MGWILLFVFVSLLKNEQLLWIKKQKYITSDTDKALTDESSFLNSYYFQYFLF